MSLGTRVATQEAACDGDVLRVNSGREKGRRSAYRAVDPRDQRPPDRRPPGRGHPASALELPAPAIELHAARGYFDAQLLSAGNP